MEVHPPDHALHNWRDFLVHLGTITLGLLIAVGIEGLVERWHHHHMVVETRRQIEEETQLNEKFITYDVGRYRRKRQELQTNIRVLQFLAQHPGTHADKLPGALNWTIGWGPLLTAEWRTAHQTGTTAFMSQEEVARYESLYAEADLVNKNWNNLSEMIFPLGSYQFLSPDPADLKPEQISKLLEGSGEALSKLMLVGLELRNWSDGIKDFDCGLTKEEVMKGYTFAPGPPLRSTK